jgi:hypothetical protein
MYLLDFSFSFDSPDYAVLGCIPKIQLVPTHLTYSHFAGEHVYWFCERFHWLICFWFLVLCRFRGQHAVDDGSEKHSPRCGLRVSEFTVESMVRQMFAWAIKSPHWYLH